MKYVIIYKLYGGPTEFLVYDNYESLEEKEDFLSSIYCTTRFRYSLDTSTKNWIDTIRHIINKYMELDGSSVRFWIREFSDTSVTGVFTVHDVYSESGSILNPNSRFESFIHSLTRRLNLVVTADDNKELYTFTIRQ